MTVVALVGAPDIAEALRAAERQVERVDDLATALDADEAFDCLVVDSDDLTSPGDGNVVFDEDAPPVVVVGDGSDAEAALDAGATDYVLGDAPPVVLSNRVESAASERRPPAPSRGEDAAERGPATGGDPLPLAEQLQTIVDNVPVVLFAFDADGTFTLSEGRGLERLGLAPGEAVGENVFDVYADVDDIVENARAALDGEQVHDVVDVGAGTFESWYRPVTNDAGEVERVIGATIDVTERHERERELERYRTLVEAVGDPMYILGSDGTIETVNRAMAEYLGMDRDALIGRSAREFLGETDFERGTDVLVDLVGDPDREWATYEVTVHTADGEERAAEINVGPLVQEGAITGSVGVLRDITERTERERELEQYETIIETVPDGVFVVDEDGVILNGNGVAADMLGYDPEELLGENFYQLTEAGVVDPSMLGEYQDVVRDLLSSNTDTELGRLEYTVDQRGGDRRVFETHLALRPYDEEFRGVVGIVRDITDRKRTEQELRRQNERLEKLASVVSHDLRNPLNVAQGLTELLADDYPDERFDDLGSSLDRMQELIEELLQLARTGETVTDPEYVGVGDLAREAWSTVSAPQADLELDVEYAASVDRSRVRQLFENLFRNAVEHGTSGPDSPADDGGERDSTGDGPATDDAEEGSTRDVTVEVGDLLHSAGFYVADDGAGIPETQRDEVFEYGFTTSRDGTGLGLAIVREIAEAHGWDVSVSESEAGGARFEFREALDAT